MTFVARPETIEKVRFAKQIVFLIGSYNGYWYNFGDLLQLKGVINWYKQRFSGALLCPIVDIQPLVEQASILNDISAFFGIDDWIFYARNRESDIIDREAEIGKLQALVIPERNVVTILHVYGGGFFNSFWGEGMLEVIQWVLQQLPVDYYILSGQQVGVEFASILAEHCRQYRPDLIGCRDPLSLQVLKQQGIDAIFSSDDAFEEMSRYSEVPVIDGTTIPIQPEFGLHLKSFQLCEILTRPTTSSNSCDRNCNTN